MSDDAATSILFYWRPGCGFCRALEAELADLGLDVERHNIWEEPEAAAFVRSVANGNETVPTVAVGPVSMVNPRGAEVLAAAREHAPHLVPDVIEDRGPGRLGNVLRKALGEVG